MEFNAVELLFLMPELCLFAATIALMLMGLYGSDTIRSFTPSGAAVALVGSLYLVFTIPVSDGQRYSLMDDFVIIDSFVQFAKALILTASLFCLVLAGEWLKQIKEKRFEFSLLLLFAVLGMMLLVSANHLIAFYLAIELMSLSLYAMAAFLRDDRAATEAGMKYFILGSLASGLILFGMSYLYGFSGVMGFADLAIFFGDLPIIAGELPSAQQIALLFGMIFLLCGIFFKLSAAPFHLWAPDVYQGVPVPVAAFFSTAPKIAVIMLLARFLQDPLASWAAQWQQVLIFVSVASMLVGALGAIVQKSLKRMLAFSSIGHVGYALMALIAATPQGTHALLIYFALYVFMSVGAFACLQLIQRGGQPVDKIDDLKGLSQNHPFAALLVAIFMFSLAGIPPLSGFFGKWMVFLAALESGFVTLAIIGVVSSVIAAYYYLRVVKVLYFDEPIEGFQLAKSGSITLLLLLLAAVSALYVLIPAPLINSSWVAASALW